MMKAFSTHPIRAGFQSLNRTSRSRKWITTTAACAAGLSITASMRANISGFTQPGNGPTDYTFNANDVAQGADRPFISDGNLLLTSDSNGQTLSAWYNTVQSVENFTASFTYTPGAGSSPPADGFAFVVQTAGLSALGSGGGALGYVGISNSVALGFDLFNSGAGTTRAGFSASGYDSFFYTVSDPVNLRVAPVDVTIAFRDGVFTETLTQGPNTAARTYNINLAGRIGSSAFVGFTGATGGLNLDQKISNFNFTTGSAPAVPAAQLVADVPQGGPGFFGVREVILPTCCGNLAEAENVILGNDPAAVRVDYTAPVINLHDSEVRGQFQGDSLYRLDPDQTNQETDTVNNIAVMATGKIRVPTSGIYTFGSNSDDGFRVTIAGQRFETVSGQAGTTINASGALEFPNGRGSNQSSLGTIYLTAGDYDIQLLNWEGNGGASVELYSSPGWKTAFDPKTFTLVGGADIPAILGKNRMVNVAPWELREYTDVNSINAVINNLGTPRGSVSTVPTIQFIDPQAPNLRPGVPNAPAFPNDGPDNDDHYGAFATTTLTIGEGDAGRYTFMMYTDDQSRFRILNSLNVPVPLAGLVVGDVFDSDGLNGADQFGTNACCSDVFGHYDLAAGVYTIEAAFYENVGGSGFFIYATQGDRNTYNSDAFQLVGENQDGAVWEIAAVESLKLVPEPGSAGLLGLAAVGLVARRQRRA